MLNMRDMEQLKNTFAAGNEKLTKELAEKYGVLNSKFEEMSDVIEKSKTVDKTLKKIMKGFDSLKDIIGLRNLPGGIIGAITTRIMTDVERGPIVNIRESYCLKSEMKRDISKT